MYEFLRRRTEGSDNSGLQPGPFRCRHSEVERLLGQLQERCIAFYRETGHSLSNDAQFLPGYCAVSSRGEQEQSFFNQIAPVVESYMWYSGLQIAVESGLAPGKITGFVILLHGWMQPWEAGGAPDPIVFLTHGISDADVLKIIRVFCENKTCFMDQRLQTFRRVDPAGYQHQGSQF